MALKRGRKVSAALLGVVLATPGIAQSRAQVILISPASISAAPMYYYVPPQPAYARRLRSCPCPPRPRRR